MSPTVAFDTNVLLYPLLERRSSKGEAAIALVRAFAPRAVVAAQALLEYLAVVRRRAPDDLDRAFRQVELWRATMTVAPTTDAVIAEAADLIRAHRFPVGDAVIWAASTAGGARFLMTEDMRDGLAIGGLTAIDPFRRKISEIIERIGS